MSAFDGLSAQFLSALLGGIAVDFEIAAMALGLGLVLGGILAAARWRGGIAGRGAALCIGLMRAAPTFVVMFFLLNALPHGGRVSGIVIVAAALVPYAAAYVADSAIDALHHFHSGSALACLLILPNLARAYFVLVMSSSVGAAIGVPEGIAIILRQADKTSSLAGVLVLFAVGVACFGVPLQAGFVVVRLVQRRLGRTLLQGRDERLREEAAMPAE